MNYTGPDISTVAAMLADRAEAFCRDHLPGGIKTGHHWRCGDVNGNPGQSLAVVLVGPKTGHWKDFSADVQGDLIDLLCANQRIGKGEALRRAKQWLGYSDDTRAISRARHEEERAKRRIEEKAAELSKDDENKARLIGRIWRDRRSPENSVVEAYLRGRGITLPPPPAIGLLTLNEHKPSGRFMPCMISGLFAPRMEGEGELAKPMWKVVAIHRTWLVAEDLEARRLDGAFVLEHHVTALGRDAKVERLKFSQNGHDCGKMVLGSPRGACIPLSAGKTRTVLAVTEGIENGLSIAQVNPDWSVWAAYSSSNFINLPVPPAVRRLILCGDADNKPGKDAHGNVRLDAAGNPIYPAEEALKRAAQLHADVAADEGRALDVEIWRPHPGKDANDMLREGTL